MTLTTALLSGALLGPPAVGFLYDEFGTYFWGGVFTGTFLLGGAGALFFIPSVEAHQAQLAVALAPYTSEKKLAQDAGKPKEEGQLSQPLTIHVNNPGGEGEDRAESHSSWARGCRSCGT
jgi:MFS family permease